MRNTKIKALGGLAAAIVMLGGCAQGSDKNAAPPDPVTVTAPAAPVVTVTATAPASATEDSPEEAVEETETASIPKPKPKPRSRPREDSWIMPNQVGADLQASQDRIQAISGNPFFYTSSRDASGQGRWQILDRDWQVCSQKPAAGSTFTEDSNITFFVVKDWESCP